MAKLSRFVSNHYSINEKEINFIDLRFESQLMRMDLAYFGNLQQTIMILVLDYFLNGPNLLLNRCPFTYQIAKMKTTMTMKMVDNLSKLPLAASIINFDNYLVTEDDIEQGGNNSSQSALIDSNRPPISVIIPVYR